VPPAEADAILGELTDAHLLAEHAPGRFRFHDLLRVYSRALAEDHGPERDRAVRRVLDHYLRTAYAADRLLDPHRDPLELPVVPTLVADAAQAREWMANEHAAIRGAIALAANSGHPAHAWQLYWCTQTFLQSSGRWAELADLGEIALAAAKALGHTTGQALAHRGLALAQGWHGDYGDAERNFDQALALHRADRDLIRQARTHLEIDWMYHRSARHREALGHALHALALYRSTHHRAGQAGALNDVGWCLTELGEHEEALVHCEQALRLHRELDNRYGQAATWHSIGYARHHLRHHPEAIAAYRSALALYRELGRQYDQAVTLDHLGDTLHATHDDTAAAECRRESLTILEQLQHPKAADVRVKLDLAGGL
jgi:tetratricopeptide (TPR) repeat protein